MNIPSFIHVFVFIKCKFIDFFVKNFFVFFTMKVTKCTAVLLNNMETQEKSLLHFIKALLKLYCGRELQAFLNSDKSISLLVVATHHSTRSTLSRKQIQECRVDIYIVLVIFINVQSQILIKLKLFANIDKVELKIVETEHWLLSANLDYQINRIPLYRIKNSNLKNYRSRTIIKLF